MTPKSVFKRPPIFYLSLTKQKPLTSQTEKEKNIRVIFRAQNEKRLNENIVLLRHCFVCKC